jgi:hypothetical protein
MKINQWTLALLGVGAISLPGVLTAEEAPQSVLTAVSSTTISGYVDTSAQWNFGSGNANVPTYSYSQGKADGFNLNVVKLALDKPISESDSWASGYKVDLFIGPDANLLASQSALSGAKSDFAIKQAYVALRAPVGNGLDLKMGVWDTIIGYELTDAPYNPNFTRSYGYTIEPTTHTGLLATYQFSDVLTANAGVGNTHGPSINDRAFPAESETSKTYLGSIVLTAPEQLGFLQGSTLTMGIADGFSTGSASDLTSYYAGATLNTPVSGFKLGGSYDYLRVSEGGLSAEAAAIYASYQFTEKLTLFGRGEYAQADTAGFFLAEEVFSATATLQYDLWANVLSRLEFRWDHAADGSEPYGGRNPGDLGSKKNSFILLANLVYKF